MKGTSMFIGGCSSRVGSAPKSNEVEVSSSSFPGISVV